MIGGALRRSVLFALFAVAVLFAALPAQASDFAFSGWQMADADGVVNLPIRLSTLQDPRVFDYMPAPTSDWYPCPSPTQINWYTSSNCTAYVQAYYKYFRTYLYVSGAMAGQTIYVRADGHIDDVVNVVVNGTDTGRYLYGHAPAASAQADITSNVNFGGLNEILFRFADTAALQRGITQVSIRTGTGIIAAYDPTITPHQVAITETTAEPDVLPAGGGTTQCSVTATDSLGHPLSYSWTASSGLGAGTFDHPTSLTPTWTSPANNTASEVTATLTVTVTCSQGQSAQASVTVMIPPASAPVVQLQISMRFDSGTENTVKPGQPYRYWISYGNQRSATEDALNVEIKASVPDNTTYIAGSARAGMSGVTIRFSSDGQNWFETQPAVAEWVRYISWTMPRLGPGQGGIVSYQVKATPPDDEQLPLTITNDGVTIEALNVYPPLPCNAVTTTVAPRSKEEKLLLRYAPVLYLHPNETLRPVPVEVFLDNATLVGDPARPDSYYSLNLTEADHSPWSHFVEPVVYGRLKRAGELTILQYWMFYLSNDWKNKHEGDWEMVQVVLDRKEKPIMLAYSQHCWYQLLSPQPELFANGTHPVVYVGLGSHSCLPSQGTYNYDFGFGEFAQVYWRVYAYVDAWCWARLSGSPVPDELKAAIKVVAASAITGGVLCGGTGFWLGYSFVGALESGNPLLLLERCTKIYSFFCGEGGALPLPFVDYAASGTCLAPPGVGTRPGVTPYALARLEDAAAPAWVSFAGSWGDASGINLDRIVEVIGEGGYLPTGGPRGPAFHAIWSRPVDFDYREADVAGFLSDMLWLGSFEPAP